MPELPGAYITHATKGRLRIKIPLRKGDRVFFSALKDHMSKFSEFPGIQKIELNPITGSILVTHTLDLNSAYLKVIAGYAEQKDIFKLEKPDSTRTSVPENIAETFKNINTKITDFTKGELDIRSVALVGLLGLGIFQISRGQFMIPAVSAFWYAATLLKDQPAKNSDQKQNLNNQEVQNV